MSRYRRAKAITKAALDANPTPAVACGCDPERRKAGWLSAGCKTCGLVLRERPNRRATDANQECALYWGREGQ
jgi:hypothetical protein